MDLKDIITEGVEHINHVIENAQKTFFKIILSLYLTDETELQSEQAKIDVCRSLVAGYEKRINTIKAKFPPMVFEMEQDGWRWEREFKTAIKSAEKFLFKMKQEIKKFLKILPSELVPVIQ